MRNIRYSLYHDFVKEEREGIYSIGLTDKAFASLEEILFLECVKKGVYLKKGEELGVMESSKAAFEILSPLSGTVVEINEILMKDASLLKKEPEEKRWLVRMLPDPLYFEKEWETLIEKESVCNC